LATLNAVLTGSYLRSAISVSVVLVGAFIVTGLLSSSYKRAREAQGHRHYEIGQALAGAGNTAGAAEEYRKALLFLPDEQEYRLSLSMALIELGRLDEAETHLQELLDSDPTNGTINLLLARVAQRRGKVTEAIDYFERAVYGYWPHDKIPVRHAARWELVSLLQTEKRRTETVGELLQLYANSPNDPKERSKIGFMLLQYGATSDAINVFRDLVRDFPRYADSYHGLGKAYLDSGDYAAAHTEFQYAVRLNANDREAQTSLEFTNSILSMDPMLPRLSSLDRVRRSRALLDRVINYLQSCGGKTIAADTPVPQNIEEAKKLLNSTYSDTDQYLDQLQDAAEQLWKTRNTACGSAPAHDQALESLMPRMGS
jgi:tetratricopeptide (TPR) repeat protein